MIHCALAVTLRCVEARGEAELCGAERRGAVRSVAERSDVKRSED